MLRASPPIRFDPCGGRMSRVPIDGYLKLAGAFYRAPQRLVHQRVELRYDRDQVWIRSGGGEAARYPRTYEQGVWQPPPVMRPEPAAAAPVWVPQGSVTPPELAAYAELCT